MCLPSQFQCKTSRECVPISKRCDGHTADCKDYSDEYDCKCKDYLSPDKVCDSHVDCHDWGDEGKECGYCSGRTDGKTWYCHLSKQCIKKEQVCDTKNDCKFKEDERYCVSLVNSPTVYVRRDGRPIQTASGLVALNQNGHWSPACVENWSEDLNDMICRYMGRTAGKSHNLISRKRFPAFGKTKLPMRYFNGHPVFPRSKRDTDDQVRQTLNNFPKGYVPVSNSVLGSVFVITIQL